VGVQVDEARRHDVTFGVDLLGAALPDLADRGDAPLPDADVAPVAGLPRAVDDLTVAAKEARLGRSR
jgi:hypothetical protein